MKTINSNSSWKQARKLAVTAVFSLVLVGGVVGGQIAISDTPASETTAFVSEPPVEKQKAKPTLEDLAVRQELLRMGVNLQGWSGIGRYIRPAIKY